MLIPKFPFHIEFPLNVAHYTDQGNFVALSAEIKWTPAREHGFMIMLTDSFKDRELGSNEVLVDWLLHCSQRTVMGPKMSST